jgi:adenylylsulfate kinase-like enzyme
VVWITGLPASGKSTLGRALVKRLRGEGVCTVLLDGDEVHEVFAQTPRYDARSRARFYRGLAKLGALLARQGQVVVIPATAHRRSYRANARELAPAFTEVFVDAPLETCRARDPKRLYARARKGAVSSLPGLSLPYEPPLSPEVRARGGRDLAAVARILARVAPPDHPAAATR